MKYFEVDGSGIYYYALIKAKTLTEAKQIYAKHIYDGFEDDYPITEISEQDARLCALSAGASWNSLIYKNVMLCDADLL